jgi:hypothetical protein
MTAFLILFAKQQRHPVLLFWEAMAYNEIRMAMKACGQYYKQFIELTEDGHTVVDVPEFVEDYCLDVLAGRAKAMRIK